MFDCCTHRAAITSPRPSSNDVATSSTFSTERLPDASLLLESPSLPSYSAVSLGGHSSIIAAARAENMSRKRESNGSALSNPQNKCPRRNVPNPRNLHNAAGGMLVPPQLSGRLVLVPVLRWLGNWFGSFLHWVAEPKIKKFGSKSNQTKTE